MYRQRGEQGAEGREIQDRWRPKVTAERIEFQPAADDYYAVVDDIESGRTVLVLSRWPDVDGLGHLVFPAEAVSTDVPLDELQPVVDGQRAAAGQPAADRPLRVGDVFSVRIPGGSVDSSEPAEWRFVDVTGPARQAAHAALLTAANPELRAPAAEAEMPAPAEPDEPPEPPPAGSAAPRV